MNERYYLLKIQLLDSEPLIWRRFTVNARITLEWLHYVIQVVMGWDNSHPYLITIGKKHYMEDPEFVDGALASYEYCLRDLIKHKGRVLRYLYDFGDRWDHKLVLENSNYINPEQNKGLAFCLEGERACPPDDVGGVFGYEEFCEARNDPGHEDHERYMEWFDGVFDTERFDIDSVNKKLMGFRSVLQDSD